MNDPRNEPKPEGFQAQIRTFAHDLAYGFVVGDFPAKIVAVSQYGWDFWTPFEGDGDKMTDYLVDKWEGRPPSISALEALGYYTLYDRQANKSIFMLTEKAFALLERPATPPSVFVSYRRKESSALGLLVVARLKLVGVPNPFIDLQIEPGEEWYNYLKTIIENSAFFISLIGPTTLESEITMQEIQWAQAVQCEIIPIWHNGFNSYAQLPPELSDKNAIRVKEESAEEYNNAIIRLLNRLGYTP